MEQRENAELCMIEWLSHENELGKNPYQIELTEEFDLHDLHYYIFKFKENMFGKWKVAVCGGYHEDELGHCGHIFSEYELYDPLNAKEKCIQMVENIRAYWMDQANSQVPPESRSTFVNFVLLENANIDFHKILNYLKHHWNIELDLSENNDDSILVGNIGESIIAFSLMDGPVPEGEAEYYAQGCYMWEDAVSHVKKHQAHIIVSMIAHDISTKEAMLIQSQCIDACLHFDQAIAVYGDEIVWPKHIYTDIMQDYAKDAILPIFLWVYLGIVTNEDGNHMYTLGLKTFGHYEIETLTSNVPLAQLHEFLFNIVCYIIEQDAVLRDGETIGMSENQKCQLSLSQGLFLNEQTLKLDVQE